MVTYSPVVRKRIEKIRNTISMRDANAQMAEECAELAQALLKLNRTFPESTNPTPKSYSQVLEDVVEAYSQVLEDVVEAYSQVLKGIVEEFSDVLESNEKKNGSSDSVSSDTQDSIHPES